MADPELTINIGDAEAAQGLGIGDAIKGRLSDSIQGMDIPSVLQKIIANSGDDEEAEEIKEKLTDVINQYNAMSDEDKNMFTSQIKEALTSKLTMKLKESGALQQIEEAMKNAIWTKLYMVAAGALLLLILIVFFGYKLYKSIKDKEKKREEKKKAKQLKKKK